MPPLFIHNNPPPPKKALLSIKGCSYSLYYILQKREIQQYTYLSLKLSKQNRDILRDLICLTQNCMSSYPSSLYTSSDRFDHKPFSGVQILCVHLSLIF